MLTRSQKAEQVTALRAKIEKASSLMIVDYRGLSVDESNALRLAFRKVGEGQIEYRVVKNTLLKRATEGTAMEAVAKFLTGPTAVAIAYDEPAPVAKALVDFAKDNEKLEIKGGAMDGEVIDLVAIQALAKLPTKHELQGMLAGTLQAPLRNLAGSLYSLLSNVRNALEARAAQLETQ